MRGLPGALRIRPCGALTSGADLFAYREYGKGCCSRWTGDGTAEIRGCARERPAPRGRQDDGMERVKPTQRWTCTSVYERQQLIGAPECRPRVSNRSVPIATVFALSGPPIHAVAPCAQDGMANHRNAAANHDEWPRLAVACADGEIYDSI